MARGAGVLELLSAIFPPCWFKRLLPGYFITSDVIEKPAGTEDRWLAISRASFSAPSVTFEVG
jgi:hypothetical protein